MNWLADILPGIKKKKRGGKEGSVPEGVWQKCEECGATNYSLELEKACFVCPSCDGHARLTVAQRAAVLFDQSPPPTVLAENVRPVDIIRFDDGRNYEERLRKTQNGDARREAAQVYSGTILERPAVAVLFDFSFMGGSMGSVVGERFVRGVEEAVRRHAAFLTFSASGGARMQEGLTSLFQMAKTTTALTRLAHHRLPHISVLTHPTTGGVAASFAMIGDVVIAEPKALIGFAGPRVIQETVRERLPEGFQHSEFLRAHGAVDMICDRRELRERLGLLIRLLLSKNGAKPGAQGKAKNA